MPNDLSFLPFFITEDLFLLPEDRQKKVQAPDASAPKEAAAPADIQKASPATPSPEAGSSATSPTSAKKAPVEAKKAPVEANKQAAATSATSNQQKSQAGEANPKLIFGKNLRKLLVLVEDPAHPVMERADGLFLKDVLKAVQYTFDDVAIVNIAHCRTEADWDAVNAISYTHFFSFGVSHAKLPTTRTLAPYELERSGEKFFLKTDKLSVLRSERARKITLWNLLKKMFV